MKFGDVQQRVRAMVSGLSLLMVWYFLFKIYLFEKGSITLDIPYNLAFLLYCVVPMPQSFSRHTTLRFVKTTSVLILALMLLWHDSWLPPIVEAGIFLNQQGIPSLSYIISFIGGFLSMSLVIVSIALLLISLLVRRYKATTTLLLTILIIAVPFIPLNFSHSQNNASLEPQIDPAAEAADTNPAKRLEAFYSSESERVILFKKPAPSAVPFDIVIVHVCSFSWDDMKTIGMTQDDPFFKQFDYFFTNFNSATGYSGPAVVRLLQSSGGQRSHNEIFKKDTPKTSMLFDGLASIGYENYVAMSHDGKYGDYLKSMKDNGLNKAIMFLPEKLTPTALFFDSKTPLFSDYAMMKKWFDARQASRSERAALYYNSVLLHAGSHWVGEKSWASRDKTDQYKEVTTVLLKDIKKFVELLKTSKRNTVLVFVPEHGRALNGSPFQPPDMRDIPLPKITRVPVGIKFIGPKFNNAKVQQHVITKPTSYFALSWLLSKFVENSPFGNNALAPDDILFKVPKTDFVSEHEWNRIIEMDGKYYYSGKDKKWRQLTQEQLK
jgi:cellulose synthase operon protein YhjU